jgi:hypothetical protein
MKYSKTLSPSLKFERIGISIVSPEVSAIRPRIPASCLIWFTLPRAPEFDIINTGLNLSIPSINAFFTSSVVLFQAFTTAFFLSSSVIIPRRYCLDIISTFLSVSSRNFCFTSGIIISEIPIVMAPLVEYLKPRSFILSSTIAVI